MPKIFASEESIRLETRKGNEIENSQATDIDRLEISHFYAVIKKHPRAIQRVGLMPLYNCHGMTFACKRTGISDNYTINLILEDDNYKEIAKENIMAGDIVLYISENGDYEHSGIIVSEPDKHTPFPRVVSKWGRGPEMIHYLHDCPYSSVFVKYFRNDK